MTSFALLLDIVVLLLALHTVVNAMLLRRPPKQTQVDEHVTVVMPVRDEARRVIASLPPLLAQQGLSSYDVLVCDDASSDSTADLVRSMSTDRLRLLPVPALPPGWLGKPHACAAGAAVARGTVLVFVDADVVVTDDAIARSVALMRSLGWEFASPYPRQLATSWLERLVQPLLQWSWLALLPLRKAESSRRPSLVAANGQLLVVDTSAYARAGGHAAVRAEVVEDVALARALRGVGARGGFADGRDLATCRMYDGRRALVNGYAKSLWRAFGSPAGGVAVATTLVLLFVTPWVLLAWTPAAWPAALGGPVSRVVAAVRTGSRPVVDAVAHPLSVLAFAGLVGISVMRQRHGGLQWKSRTLP